MSELKAFLGLHKAELTETHKVDIGGRLRGNPFTIRPLTYDEYAKIQQEAASVGRGRVRVDAGKIFEQIALTCCVDPNFSHSDFLDEHGCHTPHQLIQTLLLPGEIVELGKQIQRLSGFDTDFEELVDEAKN